MKNKPKYRIIIGGEESNIITNFEKLKEIYSNADTDKKVEVTQDDMIITGLMKEVVKNADKTKS